MKTNEEIDLETQDFDWFATPEEKLGCIYHRLGDILKAIQAPQDMTSKVIYDSDRDRSVHPDQS